MIRLLITKDGATVVPRDVNDLEEARFIRGQGFHVDVETADGKVPLDQYEAANGEPPTTEHAARPRAASIPAVQKPAAKAAAKKTARRK